VTRSRRGQPASHEEAVPVSEFVSIESQSLGADYLLGHAAGVGVEGYEWTRVENGLQQW
jgi:hypothetical protein